MLRTFYHVSNNKPNNHLGLQLNGLPKYRNSGGSVSLVFQKPLFVTQRIVVVVDTTCWWMVADQWVSSFKNRSLWHSVRTSWWRPTVSSWLIRWLFWQLINRDSRRLATKRIRTVAMITHASCHLLSCRYISYQRFVLHVIRSTLSHSSRR